MAEIRDEIEVMLDPDNEWTSLQSMRYAIVYGYRAESYIERVRELGKLDACYYGMYLPEFIPAVLDLLGVEKYTGNNKHTLNMIDAKLSIPELNN